MRLLLLRAATEAARSRALFEARGHQVLLSPVLRFAGTGRALPPDPPDAILATSARAFAHAASPRWAGATLPLYLVGARTEAAARTAGFAGPAVVAPTGAALATVLAGQPVARLLYLAGAERKSDLERALAATPHRLSVVETYDAVAAAALSAEAAAALRAGAVDAALHYSRRSAAVFLDLSRAAGIDAGATLHLCLSPDVAGAFAGCSRVRVAATPDEPGMLALADP